MPHALWVPHAAAGRQGARAAAPRGAPHGAPHGAVALKALDRTRLTPKAVRMLAQEVGIPRFPPPPRTPALTLKLALTLTRWASYAGYSTTTSSSSSASAPPVAGSSW